MTDPDPTHDADGSTDESDEERDDRHASINLEDGGFIIYDRENPQAWIQANGSSSVLEVRA